MSASVKVGGAWYSVSKLYTKVTVSGTSSWHSVATGWVKVAGVWKQWYTSLITDSFTRPNTGALGTTDTGNTWTTSFGTWYTNGTQAVSDTATSAGTAAAVAYVPVGGANAAVSASVSNGTGPAFWVSAAGSWWGSIAYSDQTSYTYDCGCACNGHSVNNTCANCAACGSTVIGSATPTTTYVYSGSATSYSAVGGACPSGGVTANGTTCYVCSSGVNGPNPSTGAGSIASCYSPSTTYSCSSGTLSGTNCVSCNSCATSACGSTFVSGGTYPSCDAYGSTCSTCTGTTTNYYVRVIYSTTTGAAYTVLSTTAVGSAPAAIKVTTSGTGASIQPYSDTAMTTALGSPITATNSGTTYTNHGIVKAYSAYSQGTTVDNFSGGA